MAFAHLHVHTEHSFLDGAATIPDLVERVLEVGQSAVAITDHGEVSGHLRFQNACIQRGIKPIFGTEGYMCDDRSERKGKKGEYYEHMTVLAKNEIGLRNLWSLSSEAWMTGSYYDDPRFDWELLERYREGLIVTTGCMNGYVASRFANGPKHNPDEGVARLARLLDIFGEDLLVELHTFDDERQRALNVTMAALAAEFGVPVVAVSDVHYLRPDEWWEHEMLTAAGTRKTFDDPTRYQYGPGQLYLMSEDDVRSRLSYLGPQVVEEAIANTMRVAERCDVLIETKRALPVFGLSKSDDEEALYRMADEGFGRRMDRLGIVGEQRKAYRLRLLDELQLVIEKGFSGYFLIVADMVAWAKSRGILVGPSRGSVGGSLLAYCLGITEIDPVKAGLLFERFLDEGRESLPDIDIDFPSVPGPDGVSPRDVIRRYLDERYETAVIGTLSVMAPKRLVRDFCRVLKVPKPDEEALVRLIETVPDLGVSQFDMDWDDVVRYLGDELAPWQEKYPNLFRLVFAFRNHLRHDSAHAAGIVVSREPLLGKVPLRYKGGEIRTQMDMWDVEALGYVKIDTLGLRTLSTLDECYRLVCQRHSDAPAHYYDWQYEWTRYYDDVDVWDSLAEGHNIGIFQLESPGLRHTIRRFRPRNLMELADLLALFRPGITRATDAETGLSLLELYLRRREGTFPVVYKHPALEPIVRRTYGQFLYQEQIMQACAAIAGYSSSEQDRVRKILGKMHRDEMRAERETFVARAVENGVPAEEADSVFDDMETFGIYGFNASHAYAYAMIAYWCAWMKHHYPREFMTALFRTNEDDSPVYMREARRLGINILPPDVNAPSGDRFVLDEGGIRWGLHTVKYVAGAADEIVQRAPFATLSEMFDALPKRRVNRRVWYSLIRVGALDSLTGGDRREALKQYLAARGERLEDEAFERLCAELRLDDVDACEMELLGTLVSHDPFAPYIGVMAKETTYTTVEDMLVGERRVLCGIIQRVRPLKTKRGSNPGQPMAQFWIDKGYDSDTVQVVAFPESYARYRDDITVGAPVWTKVERIGGGADGIQLIQLLRLDRLNG